MSLALVVACFALLVALFTLVAVVAVYARVKQLEAARTVELSGYAALVGQPAPQAVAPRPGETGSVVAVLDGGCSLCHTLWAELAVIAEELPGAPVRLVGVLDKPLDEDFPRHPRVELLADVAVRADLFEGFSPTVLGVDGTGKIAHRSFVYPDTDLHALLLDLVKNSDSPGGPA